MTKRFFTPQTVILWVIVALLVGYGVRQRFFAPTPTQRIERLLTRAAKAAEAKSVLRLSDVFTSDYSDASGIDRAGMLGVAKQFFDEADGISVKLIRILHEDPKLPAEANEAKAIVVVQVNGKLHSDGNRFSGIGREGGDAFEVGFRQRDGEWKVASSRYLQGKSPEALMRELNAGK